MSNDGRAAENYHPGDPNRLPEHVRKKLKWFYEFHYWKTLIAQTPEAASNHHFEYCYTDLFGIDRSSYSGQRILDVGCGPLNSLEWAQAAADRVGVDPLADKYVKLGKSGEHTRLFACGAEELPFEDASFDTVSSFNSLDHVDDIQQALAEMRRVCTPGGRLLLIVEVNHAPTVTEPHTIAPDFVDTLSGFSIVQKFVVRMGKQHDVYHSAFSGLPLENPQMAGVLCAHLMRAG